MNVFINKYLMVMKKYVDFSDRSLGYEYSVFVAILAFTFIIGVTIDLAIGQYDDDLKLGPFSVVIAIIHIIPAIAVSVRRLHDVDMSGGWSWSALFRSPGLFLRDFRVRPGAQMGRTDLARPRIEPCPSNL